MLSKCKSKKVSIRKVDTRKENISILLKPTHDCNFDCEYCYEKPIRDKYRHLKMDYKVIDKIIKMLSLYSKRASWIWHGGEPTLMGVKWYKDIQELFYKYDDDIKIKQSLQTNGSLLNKDWAELNKLYGIDIGISYDGNSQDVRNSKYNVKNSVLNFVENGGRCGGIAVINKENYKNHIDIYNEYKNQMKISCSMNHIFSTEGTKEFDLEMSVIDFVEEYKKFLEYWIYDSSEEAISERTVIVLMGLVLGKTNNICTYSDCRKRWLCVNTNGDIYPCDRYLPERYKMGNINEINKFDGIFDSKAYKLYYSEIEQRLNTHCKECGYLEYCNGGCNANHIVASGDGTGIDKFSCEILRRKFNITYDTLRNVDIYESNLNPHFIELINDEVVFTLKEIKSFLEEKGYSTNWSYVDDGKELFNCKEFKIFRLFNPIKSINDSEHVDRVNFSSLSCKKGFREVRNKLINDRFIEKYNEIIKEVCEKND